MVLVGIVRFRGGKGKDILPGSPGADFSISNTRPFPPESDTLSPIRRKNFHYCTLDGQKNFHYCSLDMRKTSSIAV